MKFGFSYDDILFASKDVSDDAVNLVADVFSARVFVSKKFGDVVDLESAARDSG